MAHNLLDRISAITDELSKSERRVADAVLEQPELAVTESIAQLAKRAQVSEPTVFRFCRHFGADGFPDFKLALSASLSRQPVRPVQQVKAGDTVEDVVSKVVSSTVAGINTLERTIDATVLARCIDVISQARRVAVFAQGLSRAAAENFRQRLILLGLCCEVYSDPCVMYPAASVLRQGEAVIAVSATGRNKAVTQAVKKAVKGGANIIGICPNDSELAKLCVLTIGCGINSLPEEDLLMAGRTVMTVALDILVAGVMLRRADFIGELRPRIHKALNENYSGTEKDPGAEDDKPAQNGRDELKPGTPISAINLSPF